MTERAVDMEIGNPKETCTHCCVIFQNVLEVAVSSLNQYINRIYCNVTERSRSSTVPIKAELVTRCSE